MRDAVVAYASSGNQRERRSGFDGIEFGFWFVVCGFWLEGSMEEPNVADLETKIIGALHTCFDPEIPVDIYELGLVYGIDIDPAGNVAVKMTLTSPNCPVAG